MKKCVMNESAEIYISAVDIEAANLNEWQSLELHLLDQAAVVIPGEMTVMEVVRTVESLQGLASDLLAAIGNACEKCDGCNVELLCNLDERGDSPGGFYPTRGVGGGRNGSGQQTGLRD